MGIFKLKKTEKAPRRPFTSAVIAAAGHSARMLGEDKIMAELGGTPVIVRTIAAFQGCEAVDEIVVVTREELIAVIGGMCSDYGFTKVTNVIRGGESRQESVYAGLLQINRACELAAVHDGARALVTDKVITDAIRAAGDNGAAVPVTAVKDTLKKVEDGFITETPPRAGFFAAQTPQVFRAELIKAALKDAIEKQIPITDDASAVERLGMRVAISQGEDDNIKITTPSDLALAEELLKRRSEA